MASSMAISLLGDSNVFVTNYFLMVSESVILVILECIYTCRFGVCLFQMFLLVNVYVFD